MNLKQEWALYATYNKLTRLSRKGAPLMKYITLIVTMLGTLGAPALIGNYVHAHLTLYAIFVAAALLLHASLPSIFGAPSDDDVKAADNVKLGKFGAFLLCLFILGISAQSYAQTATPVNSTGLNFTGSSEVTAFRTAGVMSAGTKITQSLDFFEYGTNKTNHFSVVSYEFLAPTPGIGFYGAGARLDPDLSKVLRKTNVNTGQLGMFAEAAVGAAVLPKTTAVGVMLGGGIKYQLTSSLGWNSLSVNYLRLGSTNAVSMSTGLSYIFK